MDGDLKGALEAAAAAYLAGDEGQAEQLLSDGILAAYAAQNARDDRNIVAGTLKVSGFHSGFTII